MLLRSLLMPGGRGFSLHWWKHEDVHVAVGAEQEVLGKFGLLETSLTGEKTPGRVVEHRIDCGERPN
jgi:hypothetical protein